MAEQYYVSKKYHEISVLAGETARQVSKNGEEWRKYLTTAARLYRYPFEDQMLIYAQRPDATACALMETWNEKMFCWVNRGAKGIALFDRESERPRLKYVFDVSDVHKARRIGKDPYLWEMREEHKGAVLAQLEKTYGATDKNNSFEGRLMEIAGRIAEDYYREIMQDMSYAKEGSFLEELDELNVGLWLRETLSASIAYTLLSRCGADMDFWKDELNFDYISEFNTSMALSVIGNATTDMCKPILMEIGRTVAAYDRQMARQKAADKARERTDGAQAAAEKNPEKVLANEPESRYNALKRESENEPQIDTDTKHIETEGIAHGTDIREERGLLNLKIVYIYIQPTDTLLADTPQKPNHTEKEFLHMKSIFEQLGGTYHEENGYLIPDLRLPAEKEQPISTWGQRHLHYLKQYRKVTYTNLLICGKLNIYLADIDKQAQERFERLIEDMKRAQGITERLKEENALEWTGRLGNIRACAREIVNEEIIYA